MSILYRVVSLFARALPRRSGYAAARQVGAWLYALRPGLRAVVAANVASVLGWRGGRWSHDDVERTALEIFRNFGKYLIDFFRLERLTDADVGTSIRISHREHLEAVLGQRRGFIPLTAHIGNWELGACVLAAQGIRVNAIAIPQRSASLERLLRSWRARRGIHVLPLGGAWSGVQSALRNGEAVVVFGDLDYSAHGRPVQFFGKPARLPRGPAVLATRTGTPILPGFALREPDDSFRIDLHPPIFPDGRHSAAEIQRRIAAIMEETIGAHLDQWFAFRPVWNGVQVGASRGAPGTAPAAAEVGP